MKNAIEDSSDRLTLPGDVLYTLAIELKSMQVAGGSFKVTGGKWTFV